MQDLANLLGIVSLILTLSGLLGGFWAFKQSVARTANEVQERVINAMEHEIDVLHQRITDLENENRRLDQIICTLCEALKRRGIIVTIEGNIVTVSDGHETQSVRIQEL
ncbi:MAG: hypothetical protein IMW89_12890 [Ktedonobacteraceae bacterium]|nr:hypothetical protein [Ktedonobacteraceae bacterium]